MVELLLQKSRVKLWSRRMRQQLAAKSRFWSSGGFKEQVLGPYKREEESF